MSTLSKEARQARYRYFKEKGYNDTYWERRAKREAAAREQQQGDLFDEDGKEKIVSDSELGRILVRRVTKTVEEYFRTDDTGSDRLTKPLPKKPDNYTEEMWSIYLEDLLKEYQKEFKKMRSLLRKYEGVIKIGLESLKTLNY